MPTTTRERGWRAARASPSDVCGWLLQIRERYDGHGPEGLAGESIPIAARVARVACACDTLLAWAGEASLCRSVAGTRSSASAPDRGESWIRRSSMRS